VQHIFRDENIVVNDLAQQASSFQANRGKFGFLEKLDVLVYKSDSLIFGGGAVRQSILLDSVHQN
jgi:hypothetical protein